MVTEYSKGANCVRAKEVLDRFNYGVKVDNDKVNKATRA